MSPTFMPASPNTLRILGPNIELRRNPKIRRKVILRRIVNLHPEAQPPHPASPPTYESPPDAPRRMPATHPRTLVLQIKRPIRQNRPHLKAQLIRMRHKSTSGAALADPSLSTRFPLASVVGCPRPAASAPPHDATSPPAHSPHKPASSVRRTSSVEGTAVGRGGSARIRNSRRNYAACSATFTPT